MERSRGRMRRADRSCFAFGSSTPRDLSYMSAVPVPMRAYDSKPKPAQPSHKEDTLAHYMRQARSMPPQPSSGSRDGSTDRLRSPFAFGSSTPRQFSHLSTIGPHLRVYDVKIRKLAEKRSYTTPVISTTRSKTVPASARSPKPPAVPITKHEKQRSDDDEIASEPDFVQDRHERELDFLKSVKRKQQAAKEERKASQGGTVVAGRHESGTEATGGSRRASGDSRSGKRAMSRAMSSDKEDSAVELPLEATQPCILPQNVIDADVAEHTAKSTPSIRPLNDSSEVVVQYDEKTPEQHEVGFLGSLADRFNRPVDIPPHDAVVKTVDSCSTRDERSEHEETALETEDGVVVHNEAASTDDRWRSMEVEQTRTREGLAEREGDNQTGSEREDRLESPPLPLSGRSGHSTELSSENLTELAPKEQRTHGGHSSNDEQLESGIQSGRNSAEYVHEASDAAVRFSHSELRKAERDLSSSESLVEHELGETAT